MFTCAFSTLCTCLCVASTIKANLKLAQSKGQRYVHVLCGYHEYIAALKREYSLLMSDTTTIAIAIAIVLTNYNNKQCRRSKST